MYDRYEIDPYQLAIWIFYNTNISNANITIKCIDKEFMLNKTY